MIDRLLSAFETVQDKYLRDPEFAGAEARYRHVRRLRELQDRVAGELWDDADRGRAPDGLHGADAVTAALEAHARAEDRVIERDIIGRLPHRAVHECATDGPIGKPKSLNRSTPPRSTADR
jgi:hypothetical protein